MHSPWKNTLPSPKDPVRGTDKGALTAGGSMLLLGAVSSAACRICGRRPHPSRMRLTLAKLGAVLPVEFVLHALVMHYHLSYVASVVSLALATTVLVIWVVEPSTMRLLTTWLYAPQDSRDHRFDANLVLWRIRTTLEDAPGALERITHALTKLDANILSLMVHPLETGVLDEIVVATNRDVHRHHLTESLYAAGGRDIEVDTTSPLALVDVETRALDFAARVAANPAELSQVVGTLLGATAVTDRGRTDGKVSAAVGAGTETLRIPAPWTAPLLFDRPGRPFTPAESARAHRLAIIAETVAVAR